MSRFIDEGTTLYDFMDQVLVVCPRCAAAATVSRLGDDTGSRLTCGACGHARASADSREASAEALGRVKEKGVVRARCPRCRKVTVKEAHFPLVPERETLVCACGATLRAHGLGGYPPAGRATDPFFGLPLWLSLERELGHLWALNGEHLAWLKAYVAADLREQRAPNHHNLDVVLPAWIKSAKHRAAVLALIEKLEAKLAEASPP
ncbi:MAG: hypothetical protein P1V51_00980 [Deltaproteobacteria bacterium]|nr:hypothetical protein [Deltaproteobacteria bacterium]